MATAEERRKILEMVASGKLSAAEAAGILGGRTEAAVPQPPSAPEPAQPAPAPPREAPAPARPEQPAAETEGGQEPAEWKAPTAAPATASKTATQEPRWLRVRFEDQKSNGRRVTVKIPLKLVKAGIKLGSGLIPELQQMNWRELADSLKDGDRAVLVDVEDEADGQHVRVTVE